ncbi:MAG: hypothetical protein WCZ20_00515 [Hydrogenophaga sp.]|jgi:hypothetical protein|uniref:hypothetical protein n=1 Tax=Hydrogenophaga sp. TaxID=1904254 RepID=UPI002604FD8E|nr:hypothetical protein [Hydrogenophaga sp.]MDD3784356.1 hypothetical protein [Hydrogenophaga sp.]
MIKGQIGQPAACMMDSKTGLPTTCRPLRAATGGHYDAAGRRICPRGAPAPIALTTGVLAQILWITL